MMKLLFMMFLFFLPVTTCKAAENQDLEPKKMRVTCYVAYNENPITRDGTVPYEGICAGRYEDLGKVAIVYSIGDDGNIGDIIGIFEIRDTGGHKGLKNGTRIDIYRDSLSRCREWIKTYGDYCYVQILPGYG